MGSSSYSFKRTYDFGFYRGGGKTTSMYCLADELQLRESG